MPWCPKCKTAFPAGETECMACHIPLVDSLPAQQDMEPQADDAATKQVAEREIRLQDPIAVYTAAARINAEMIRDMLRDSGIDAEMRQVMTQHAGAVTGRRAQYVVEVLVESSDTARARALIDETKQALEEEQMDEDELARLAEEQALEMDEQPMEDNASFKLLPVVTAVIVVALVLLYFVMR
nr:DUF2007 domain-containing protein [uncultured Agathobaculum sp.]